MRATHSSRTMRSLSAAARSSIPMMLDGTGMPVSHTANSPAARKMKRMPHCRMMFMIYGLLEVGDQACVVVWEKHMADRKCRLFLWKIGMPP